MLFYNQIKREFSRAAWNRGRTYFQQERVKDVRLDGDLVVGKVQGSDRIAYDTAVFMARGAIINSKCSCPAHRLYETHCKHVAALGIWVVERGSLLRLGIATSDLGVAKNPEAPGDQSLVLNDPERAKSDIRLRKLMMAHPFLAKVSFVLRRDKLAGQLQGNDLEGRSFSIPITLVEAVAMQEMSVPEEEVLSPRIPVRAQAVAFVRGLFQSRMMTALTIEPALRYLDPDTQVVQVQTLNYLVRDRASGAFRNTHGVILVLDPKEDPIPVLGSVDAAKIIHQGQQAVDQLARLLTAPERERIYFHPSVDMEVDPSPLKLVSVNIGARVDKTRKLSYEFSGGGVKFSSDELSALSSQGRLGGQYVWKDNRLFKFDTSLTTLARYANRSGVAATEQNKSDFSNDGFGALADDGENPLHPLAAYRLSLELGVESINVADDWEEYHEWKKTFEKKRMSALPAVDYGFELRDYQMNGLSWMWSLYHRGLAALLADDMGLGKTHQVLAFLTTLYAAPGSKKKPGKPTLVVAPTSVVAAWIQKLAKYETGLKWYVFHGKDRAIPAKGVDIVLTTYGILQREEELRTREWHVVVLDEAQAIKNATTISSRASRVLKSQFRIAMTGTPVENQSLDLWSIMEFLLPGYLGSLPRFKRLYGSERDMPSQMQAEALKRLISPFLLRRTKSQVLKELPEKTEEVRECELAPAQKRAYRATLNSNEALKARESLEAGGKVDYANILALLTRLKQICDHPRLPDLTHATPKEVQEVNLEDAGKWDAFLEILNEALGSNLKIVVFTQYLKMMDLIGIHLKTIGVGYTDLRGDTTDRAARLEKFADEPECKVFVCSLLAGGLGIDLTAGSVCIHYDRWWNPAKENQATDRLHRIGQTRGVQVFKLQIPGTVEDRIAQIIGSKLELSGALIEESPLGLKSFSRKELLELLTAQD